jgi:hypothetical protein
MAAHLGGGRWRSLVQAGGPEYQVGGSASKGERRLHRRCGQGTPNWRAVGRPVLPVTGRSPCVAAGRWLPRPASALAAGHPRILGIVNASVTHMGILTERGAARWNPAPAGIHHVGRQPSEYVRSRRARITDVALLFALAHPYIATTCVGMKSIDHVTGNLEVLGGELDPELLAEIEETLLPSRTSTGAKASPSTAIPVRFP